jgi:DNA-binding YbaB/EbfC family protein
MKDIMGLMKQAQEMQARMQELQADLERVEVEGIAGGGLVRVRMTAKGELRAIDVDDSLVKVDEKEILEDLIITAHAEARKKGEAMAEEKMKSISAGLPLPPGFKLPF